MPAEAVESDAMPHDHSLNQEPPSVFPGRDGPVPVYAVVFDGDAPFLDNGALHGRSRPERGVRFGDDASVRERGRRVLAVWVATGGTNPDAPFVGVVASEYWVDGESGFKDLTAHSNAMSAAARGTVQVAALSAGQRQQLVGLLEGLSPGGWAATPPLVKLFLTAR
jgi:hypothetical protein